MEPLELEVGIKKRPIAALVIELFEVELFFAAIETSLR
jgi:hypothetical protein